MISFTQNTSLLRCNHSSLVILVLQYQVQSLSKTSYRAKRSGWLQASEYSELNVGYVENTYSNSVIRRYGKTDEARNKNADIRLGTKKLMMMELGQRKQDPDKKTALENIKYNNDFQSTTGSRFHTDHANLCIGAVQITNGELSEIFCSSLVGGRDSVNKRSRESGLNGAWRIILRNVAEGVTFWICL